MLCRTIGSSVSSVAASNGSAAFLFPAGVTSPFNGTPPSITNLSMFISRGTAARGVRDCKAVCRLRQEEHSLALARDLLSKSGGCAPSAGALLTVSLHAHSEDG